MHYTYNTGMKVCAYQISFDLNDNIVTNIEFKGGCNGNLKAISKLLEGMNADEIIKKLEGNTCRNNDTSCADQLTVAIKKAKEEINNAQ